MPETPVLDVETLLAATAQSPDHTYRSPDGRHLTWYWILPGTEADYSGCRPTARLTVEHDKGAKRYRAVLERTDFALVARGTREAFNLRRGQKRLLVRDEPVVRFSAARFDAFRIAAEQGLAALREQAARA